MNSNSETTPQQEQYQVVALKYRPQSFVDLVGQGHIATALSNAISKNRVGHAYLFTGARGVGKTSSARIFAKCLNCQTGPTMAPCNQCDVCQSVSTGDDVDVLEIDGASNRGIDEIRQLRSNAAVRPSRAKYKIYIIDEVHMLTTPAFNALLKTLEEPPAHVKFIFCTTDPQKIPITVLSRCQRFDFSPVQTVEIAQRLREIAQSEGVTADEEALMLLARRANGSMRDSQSLLEQLFSFCGQTVTVDEVHQLLGTSDMGRIAEIATAISQCNPSETLNLMHRSILEGVDPGKMADQLLGYFRDMMAAHVGCGADTMLNCTAADMAQLQTLAQDLGLETILTIVQLFDNAVVRMQSSLHSRTLLEAAAIRACNLEKLDAISDLVGQLSQQGAAKTTVRAAAARKPRVQMQQVDTSQTATSASKKKEINNDRLSSTTSASATDAKKTHSQTQSLGAGTPPAKPSISRTIEQTNVESTWKQILEKMGDMTADMASDYEKLELQKPDQLVVTLRDAISKDLCSKPDRKQKFESELESICGYKIRVDFLASPKSRQEHAPAPKLSRVQQIRKLHEIEFVKQTISLFDAEITGYQEPQSIKKT